MANTSALNGNQLEAVNWGDGPLLALAGPGSGKTCVLTYRIAHLISVTPNRHFRILGLTFTNSAAKEMRERIVKLVANAEERTLLTTFHSFAADLLRQHGHHIGLKPSFTILTQDADRHSLLDEAIERANLEHDWHVSERLLHFVSRLIENSITPEKALEFLESHSFKDSDMLASIYANYRFLMRERNTIDFPGLIAEAFGLLRSHSGVRNQIQRIYPYICVDEFQDTNMSQYKILCQLVNEKTKNLFVVADDDQIIYQWNGANPKRLKTLQEKFGMKTLQLPENYRCPSTVVEIANKLIAHNLDSYSAKYPITAYKKASKKSGVVFHHFSRFSEEVDWVASSIANKSKKERAECVVLARTRKLLEFAVNALGEHQINAYLASRKNEFESAPLQWLHSILRLANLRDSREHLRRVCKAFFTLGGIDLNVKDIISRANANGSDYLRSWAEVSLSRAELSDQARELIRRSLIPILLERLDFCRFQKDAFDWLDALPNITPDDEGVFDEYLEERKTWNQLVEEISMQYGEGEVSLHLLLQEMDLRSKSPVPPKDAVPCFTIHASKGREFDHVYLIALVED